MLCNSCQKQQRCLPARLAQSDAALATMLEQLQDCSVQVQVPSGPRWLALLRRGWQHVTTQLRHWGQRWHIGVISG